MQTAERDRNLRTLEPSAELQLIRGRPGVGHHDGLWRRAVRLRFRANREDGRELNQSSHS